MEPRHSMTAYAVCVAAAICLLAAKGLQAVAFAAAIGVIVAGATLSTIYRHWRAGRNAPAHRATLDRLVLGQWLGAGAVGAAAAVTLATTGTAPLRGADVVWHALIVAFAVATIVVFISSLIDWYWILPRVSGIVCPGPCEAAGRRAWTYVTGHWFFHRSMAEFGVGLSIVGFFGYLGFTESGKAALAWGAAALAASGAVAKRERRAFTAFQYGLDPPVCVGDVISVRYEDSSDEQLRREWAYVVDVSVDGVKVVMLEEGRFTGPTFSEKSDYKLLPTRDLHLVKRRPGPAPCADRCRGVNWYCRNNELAYRQSLPPISGPAALTERARASSVPPSDP